MFFNNQKKKPKQQQQQKTQIDLIIFRQSNKNYQGEKCKKIK